MKRLLIASVIAVGIGGHGQAQSPITTIERGNYVCELPGDAAGRIGRPQPDENFSIASASRYVSARGSGTYLRRGDQLVFSSGPRQGEVYHVVSRRFLRRIAEGELSHLRCVRQRR